MPVLTRKQTTTHVIKITSEKMNHDGRTTPTLAKASDAQAGKSRLGNNLRKKSCTKAGNLVGKLSFHNAHTKTQKAIEKKFNLSSAIDWRSFFISCS